MAGNFALVSRRSGSPAADEATLCDIAQPVATAHDNFSKLTVTCRNDPSLGDTRYGVLCDCRRWSVRVTESTAPTVDAREFEACH